MPQPRDDISTGARVWVVDDDPDCRMLVRDAIAGASPGWQVSEIADGGEALELLRRVAGDPQQRPDLIVLDVDMAGVSGLDVLRAAKADPSFAGIPVVMLTGAATSSLRAISMRIGATECYEKPASAVRFRRTVLTAVQHCLRVGKARQFNRAAWRETKTDGPQSGTGQRKTESPDRRG